MIKALIVIDEFDGARGDFYKNMFAKCPAGRPCIADEIANVAELLMNPQRSFITVQIFLLMVVQQRHIFMVR